ncbi:MAG TPA: 2-hydroxycarboxylate transporter family protein [Caulobacteraceae bacterium]|nr:2-hydroxycarboxylate transporter family protein [Caulobacteraceae bacterium]
MTDAVASDVAPVPRPANALAWWWRIMDFKIGVVPAPIFAAIVGVAAVFVSQGKAPADIVTNMAVLAAGGFACAELGKRLPYIRDIGAAAIFATFIPSYLVFAHLLPQPLVTSITDFTKSSNLLYLFISSIIVGSILGMDRRVLVSGFLKVFLPLALGSLAAVAVGCGVGASLGLGLHHTLFRIVVPIMAGGVGEGALPLSIGYAAISHQPQGAIFGEVLPPVMLGSLTAIILAGALNHLGKLRPDLTGQGRLQVGEARVAPADVAAPAPPPSLETVAGAAVMAATLYLVGTVVQTLWQFPAPVTMLLLTVALKLGRLVSPDLERGAYSVYQFFRVATTYPLLFAIGVSLTPWEKLVAAFNLPTIVTIVATVATLMATGFGVARFVGMYPIDVAIVNACHTGQGGTGDVAILSAANRMQLMPFAQIATRIGGALTVTLALIALRTLGA